MQSFLGVWKVREKEEVKKFRSNSEKGSISFLKNDLKRKLVFQIKI